MQFMIPERKQSSVRTVHKVLEACRQHGDPDTLKELSRRLDAYQRTSETLESADGAVSKVLAILDELSRELFDILGE